MANHCILIIIHWLFSGNTIIIKNHKRTALKPLGRAARNAKSPLTVVSDWSIVSCFASVTRLFRTFPSPHQGEPNLQTMSGTKERFHACHSLKIGSEWNGFFRLVHLIQWQSNQPKKNQLKSRAELILCNASGVYYQWSSSDLTRTKKTISAPQKTTWPTWLTPCRWVDSESNGFLYRVHQGVKQDHLTDVLRPLSVLTGLKNHTKLFSSN